MICKKSLIFSVLLLPQMAFGITDAEIENLRYKRGTSQEVLNKLIEKRNLQVAWGNGYMNTCQGHAIEMTSEDYANGKGACIGESRKDNCRANLAKHNEYTDEGVILMLVAQNLTTTGVYLCPTQVEARNERKGDSWTRYRDLTNNDASQCVWLCKDVYMGPKCEEPVTESTACIIPEGSAFNAKSFDKYKIKDSGDDITSKIILFDKNEPNACGHNKGYDKHDMFLALIDWDPGEHGAFVQEVVIRPDRSNWKDWDSVPFIYPAQSSQSILVCQSGYRPNVSKTRCELIETQACKDAQKAAQEKEEDDENSGTGQQENGDSDTTQEETKVILNEEGKLEVVCREIGYGFAPGTKECIKCEYIPLRTGKNAKGECVTCPVGTVFDINNTTNNNCSAAKKLTKDMLLYGIKASSASDPCWQKPNSEYTNCVLGKSDEL